jgi:hypothetical protein
LSREQLLNIGLLPPSGSKAASLSAREVAAAEFISSTVTSIANFSAGRTYIAHPSTRSDGKRTVNYFEEASLMFFSEIAGVNNKFMAQDDPAKLLFGAASATARAQVRKGLRSAAADKLVAKQYNGTSEGNDVTEL